MKRKKQIICLFIILVVSLIMPVLVVQAQGSIPLEIGISGDKSTTGIVDYIDTIYKFAAAIVGGLAAVMIVIGGVQYASAAGNQKAIGSAKETITSAIIGLVVVGLSYLILGVFGNQFVVLTEPNIPAVSAGKPFEYEEGEHKDRTCKGAGEKYYDDAQTCDQYCQAKYSRSCSSVDISKTEKGYCCKEEQANPANDQCAKRCKKIEPRGLCMSKGPCWQVLGKDVCERNGIPTYEEVNNTGAGGTYDATRCTAMINEWKNVCADAKCGLPEFKAYIEGNYWCCGFPE